VSYTATYITSLVTQVSAGVDSSGHATAFTLSNKGSLDEYTAAGAFKTHVGNNVSGLSASQMQSDTVYYLIGSLGSAGILAEQDGLGNTHTHWGGTV
jgi:hypothetical protein